MEISKRAYIIFYIAIVALMSGYTLVSNQFFTYTLDDPYIHIQVAKNILKGTYGLNFGEFSAPSSSILWPFVLAFVSALTPIPVEYIPLLLNFVFGGLTLYGVLLFTEKTFNKPLRNSMYLILFFVLFAAGNLFGLIFNGMEHSLQLALVVWIVYFLLFKRSSSILYILLLLAPLVRYEDFAITVPLLFYLYVAGHKTKAIATFSIAIVIVSLFSLFLYMHGLGLLPTSIIIKTGAYSDSYISNIVLKFFSNLSGSLTFTVLYIAAISSYIGRICKQKLLLYVIVSMTLHAFFGGTGWLYRYENYIVIYAALMLVYLHKELIAKYVDNYRYKLVIPLIAGVIFLNPGSIVTQIATATASKNIAQQQYRMGTLVKYLNQPVAANDIGLVSLLGGNYVLDLYGLASKKAMQIRLSNDTSAMDELVKKKGIRVIMIYSRWFKKIPKKWRKVAVLKSKGILISPIGREVSFYISNKDDSESAKRIMDISKKHSLGLEAL